MTKAASSFVIAAAVIAAAACFFLACGFAPAGAADGGLYPDAAPPGSAFLRFLNAGGARLPEVAIEGKSYGAAAVGKVTRYVPLPQGDAAISFGSAETTASLKEGKRYCAVLSGATLKIIEEPEENNPLKAQIVLINASSSEDISLRTADGSVSIVEPVGPWQAGGRAVNAVKVPLSLYDKKGRKIQDFAARDLMRGQRYAVIIYDGPGGKPAAVFN